MQPAALLVHDDPGARRGRLDVEVGVMRELAQLLRLRVPGEQVHRAVAVGDEIDDVADPHRPGVARVVMRHRLDVLGLEVEHPEERLLPAAVAPPGVLGPEVADGVVDHSTAVRRVRPALRHRHGERLLEAPVYRDGEQPVVKRVRGARRAEEHLFAVRRPALHQVGPGVVGEAPRVATVHRDDVDVGVAVVLPREGDPASVGGKSGLKLAAGMHREPPGFAAPPPWARGATQRSPA